MNDRSESAEKLSSESSALKEKIDSLASTIKEKEKDLNDVSCYCAIYLELFVAYMYVEHAETTAIE